MDARKAVSADPKRQAGLRFVELLLQGRGTVDDTAFADLGRHGYTSAEIAEVLAQVGFNLFANYFNLAAGTTPDFAAVAL